LRVLGFRNFTLPPAAGLRRVMRPRVEMLPAAPPDRCVPIACPGVSVTAGGGLAEASGSTPRLCAPSCRVRRAILRGVSAMRRAIRLPGPARFRTICRCQRRCRWATRAAWKSAHGQQCLQHRAVLRRGHQRRLPTFGAGNFGGRDAVVQFSGEVQVLSSEFPVSKSGLRSNLRERGFE
jgi:hypothetical protein